MPESSSKGASYYDKLISETSRQLAICNACRYCEGYCAVWDAIEYRKEFTKGDVTYLSNLCYDCGECFDVCPFVPPHEFNVDIPSAMSEVRKHTYKEYATPSAASNLYEKPGMVAGMLGTIALITVFVVFLLTGNPSRLTTSLNSPGSFYFIIPNIVIDLAGSLLALFVIFSWTLSARKFLKGTSGGKIRITSVMNAVIDGLSGKWMKGGGAGCNYPERESDGSYLKFGLHSLIVYGFLLDLLATIVAFIEQDVFGITPPFPLISIPVISGTAGGLLIIAGVSFFIYFDRSEDGSKKREMKILDRAFMVSLLLTAVTGLLLLILRATPFMGTMLIIHISVVSTLFITAPYGKFVHLVYRGVSTMKYYDEKAVAESH